MSFSLYSEHYKGVFMKFIVDKMPKEPKTCPFSQWVSCSLIMKNDGEYKCTVDNRYCDYQKANKSCRWLTKQGGDSFEE